MNFLRDEANQLLTNTRYARQVRRQALIDRLALWLDIAVKIVSVLILMCICGVAFLLAALPAFLIGR